MSPLYPAAWDEIEAPHVAAEPPGPRSREILARIERTAYPGTGGGLSPLALAGKTGWTVADVDGNVFLDCASASASVPLGAGRTELLEPAIAAIERFGNEDSHALASELMAELGERLLAVSPASLRRYDIALNGTEAVEIAVKMMRRATGRPIILAFHGSYHGESTTTAALGAEASEISRGLRGLVPGFVHVPYPHAYRTPFRDPRPGGTGDATVDYIRDHVLFHALDPADVAGVVIEPVLGSGGCVAPPDPFWPALTELCREHGWLLCADEVKTGMGRAGHLFAVERWGVEPDLMCLGKALGGGVMPIGALLGSERVLGSFDDVPTGSTWAWLPGRLRGGAGDARPLRRRAGARERRRARSAGNGSARRAARALRADRRRARRGLLPGDRVRPRSRDLRARCRAPARGGDRDAAPRGARGFLDHLDQHPTVADHAGSGARPGLRDRPGLDRGGARRSVTMTLETELGAELAAMSEAGTRKRIPVLHSPQGPLIEIEGRGEVICLCSNDYLGLANHPDVVAAAADGLARYGAGTASVRFICGKFAPHVELEHDLAEFCGTPAALTYVSCWNANAALLDALCDRPAAIFSDRLNHASIIDGMRLARPAHKAVYEHSDPDDLRRALREAPSVERRLIVTDGVFSMEGDLAPIPELAAIAAEHEATLIVDDSHGIGVVGETGRGVVERFGLLGRDDIVLTGTLGKALGGAAGGFVAGGEALCEVLEQRSRAQLFSNGLPPSVACSARRALAELRDRPALVARLRANVAAMRDAIAATGLEPLEGESAIVPIIVGATPHAIRASELLLERGVYATGFGYPVVPEGTARVRVQVSAALEPSHLARAAEAIGEVGRELGLATTRA